VCSKFAAAIQKKMQRLITNTLTILSNLPIVRYVLKMKDDPVIGGKYARLLLVSLFICMALFTLVLAWQEDGPLRTELFSAFTIFSLLMLLRLLSTGNRVNDN